MPQSFCLVQLPCLADGSLHLALVVDVDAGLPGERRCDDVLSVAIVIGELRVVRAAEGKFSLQSALFLFVCGRCNLLRQ